MKARIPDTHPLIAIIGDIVSSRDLVSSQRKATQKTLIQFLDNLNRTFRDSIVADFTVIRGDEFEALIRPAGASHLIPDVIWNVTEKFPGIAFRFGIGLGTIDTAIERDPRVADGSAFHNAREAIDRAKSDSLLGGVFSGFRADQDEILNGIARLLNYHRESWTHQQSRLAQLLRSNPRQSDAATNLGISKQAVSAYARDAGWKAYLEGETAWRKAIEAALDSVSFPRSTETMSTEAKS